jgi:hypothetical protein
VFEKEVLPMLRKQVGFQEVVTLKQIGAPQTLRVEAPQALPSRRSA